MKKLKNLSMGTGNNFPFTTMVFLLFIFGCNQNGQIRGDLSIDLCVKYENQLNCFKIESDGYAFVLIKQDGENDRFYNVVFTEDEMGLIRKSLKEINFAECDSVDKVIFDKAQYVLKISNETYKKQVISGTCIQLQPLDSLVKFIIETYNNKEKQEVFSGLRLMNVPVPENE